MVKFVKREKKNASLMNKVENVNANANVITIVRMEKNTSLMNKLDTVNA